MTWAYIGAAAVTAIASDINQGDEVRTSPAPAPTIGGGAASPVGATGGLLGMPPKTDSEPITAALQAAQTQKDSSGQNQITNSEYKFPQLGKLDPIQESLKKQSLADIDNGPDQKPGGFGSFLGGLDKGLQSPSQMLGLGLLSRLTNQNPYAGLGGLLAMGLYNRNK